MSTIDTMISTQKITRIAMGAERLDITIAVTIAGLVFTHARGHLVIGSMMTWEKLSTSTDMVGLCEVEMGFMTHALRSAA